MIETPVFRRHADGTIDFDFYRSHAAQLRRQAMRDLATQRIAPHFVEGVRHRKDDVDEAIDAQERHAGRKIDSRCGATAGCGAGRWHRRQCLMNSAAHPLLCAASSGKRGAAASRWTVHEP